MAEIEAINNSTTEKKLGRDAILTYVSEKIIKRVDENEVLIAQNIFDSGFTYLGPGLHLLNPFKRFDSLRNIDHSFTLSFERLRTKRNTSNGTSNSTSTTSSQNDYQDEGPEITIGSVKVRFRIGARTRTIVKVGDQDVPKDIPVYLPSYYEAEKAYRELMMNEYKRLRGESDSDYEAFIDRECNSFVGKRRIRKYYKNLIDLYLNAYGDKSYGAFYKEENALEEAKEIMSRIIIKIVNNSTKEQLINSSLLMSRDRLPDYLYSKVKEDIVHALDDIRNRYGIEIVSFGTGDTNLPEEIRKAKEEQARQEIENQTNYDAAVARRKTAEVDAEAQKLLQAVPYEVVAEVIKTVGVDADPMAAAMVLTRAVTGDNVSTIVETGSYMQYVPGLTNLMNMAKQNQQSQQTAQPQQQGRSK